MQESKSTFSALCPLLPAASERSLMCLGCARGWNNSQQQQQHPKNYCKTKAETRKCDHFTFIHLQGSWRCLLACLPASSSRGPRVQGKHRTAAAKPTGEKPTPKIGCYGKRIQHSSERAAASHIDTKTERISRSSRRGCRWRGCSTEDCEGEERK